MWCDECSPPEAAVSGSVPPCHGDNEKDLRRVASPVHQSKVVSVCAIETHRCSKVRSIRLPFTATVCQCVHREQVPCLLCG